ncbi:MULTISPECIES: YhcB family protein [unclassified Halomonas]|uniref:YhcB family protein n=1 Tax=unclassified Halomonas TaxID=2609666 RepID=UPI0021E40FB4|nr:MULTISPECIES: YhcB family protein [unclassified Halomonas]UYF98542.1 YhcB family protein [Halomonas sp. GD1P12]WNL43676.1 YhcB family protein [Halomonas sp. PAMB 3264]
MEANSPLLFVLIGLVIGFLIGLLCYRLMSKGERHRASLKQTLLEREHQIAELKKAQGRHVGEVRQCLEAIRHQADELEDKLDTNTEQWELAHTPAAPFDETVQASKTTAPAKPAKPAAPAPAEATSKTPQTSETPPTPRDYADGKGGTLSEEYGLKDSRAKEPAVDQPPRY